jgi:glycosyltransferase involved in cell wall biosynthesis
MYLNNQNMTIAIDLTPLYGRKATGVELYAIDLYRSLLDIGKHRIVPIFHTENTLDSNADSYIIKKCNRLWLENIALPLAVRKIKADITLFPIFPPPVSVYNTKSLIIPTLHDFAFLKYRDTINTAAKYYLTPKMLWAFKKANGIITISETIKKELATYTQLPIFNLGENISHEYVDCQSQASLEDLSIWKLNKDGYYISVSTIEPRKNFKYLLKVIKPILETRQMKLVLVGRLGWGKDQELKSLIESMKDYLVFTDYLPINQLISLYKYAHAFILLSLDEGFGRTPFEAVACGCRQIILSDIPIFRETFNNNALFLPLCDETYATKLLDSDEIVPVSDKFRLPFNVLKDRIPVFLQTINA